jgi:hypothetical protein
MRGQFFIYKNSLIEMPIFFAALSVLPSFFSWPDFLSQTLKEENYSHVFKTILEAFIAKNPQKKSATTRDYYLKLLEPAYILIKYSPPALMPADILSFIVQTYVDIDETLSISHLKHYIFTLLKEDKPSFMKSATDDPTTMIKSSLCCPQTIFCPTRHLPGGCYSGCDNRLNNMLASATTQVTWFYPIDKMWDYHSVTSLSLTEVIMVDCILRTTILPNQSVGYETFCQSVGFHHECLTTLEIFLDHYIKSLSLTPSLDDQETLTLSSYIKTYPIDKVVAECVKILADTLFNRGLHMEFFALQNIWTLLYLLGWQTSLVLYPLADPILELFAHVQCLARNGSITPRRLQHLLNNHLPTYKPTSRRLPYHALAETNKQGTKEFYTYNEAIDFFTNDKEALKIYNLKLFCQKNIGGTTSIKQLFATNTKTKKNTGRNFQTNGGPLPTITDYTNLRVYCTINMPHYCFVSKTL